ncbi:uncharacterized protein LOC136071856 [Hydra vulgaris]|uniref:Mannosyl-oligosaccharide glucosidase n=1 Tax=Hydra vulgaris TaxID=6087 RepID=A0ABM4BW51_HYDVU
MSLRARKTKKGNEKSRVIPFIKKNNKNNKFFVCFLVLCSFSVSFAIGWSWHLWVESRHYTPLNAPKAILHHEEHLPDNKLWGTYRPHLYFGVRAKTPQSLLFGLMWFAQYSADGQLHIRYTCEQSDNLPKYGWLKHDGESFGSQEIIDNDFILTTNFLKKNGGRHGGDWTAQVKGRKRYEHSKQVVSVMFIVTNEGNEDLYHIVSEGQLLEVYGETSTLGSFKIKFFSKEGVIKLHSYLASYESDIYDAKQAVMKNLKYFKKSSSEQFLGLPGDVKNNDAKNPNFFVYQVTFELPFTVEIVFESGSHLKRKTSLSGNDFLKELSVKVQNYDIKFEKVFNLSSKGYSMEEISFAKAAISNMIGGIGYFYGNSLIKTANSKEPYEYWKSDLLTAVPSRSFFPRGFLWDEGFHQLLIQRWDSHITQDVLSHWLNLVNYHGWIPREQILGVEAKKKVPDEFVVQHYENANPPTFFLTLQALIDNEKYDVSPGLIKFLRVVYPRLNAWFQWFNTTQVGKVAGTYRWRGRDAKIQHELNPKTLTSGLDDYPRASHPSSDERHVDLRCWIAVAAGVLADIADIIGISSKKFRETEVFLKDNKLLDKLHWSEGFNSYADYGNHTKNTKLEWVMVGQPPQQQRKLLRVIKSEPSLKFVDEFGYVSIFPFLLKILEPTSSKLKIILDDLYNPKKLWTPYGLRSLSSSASMYNKRNTEHDKPYWRGPIWININFLAVKALQFYSTAQGPYMELSQQIYKELRHNIVSNIYQQYKRTGYIWEQYDDSSGVGQGCYPFTGWSALVTLMMAEE